MSVSGPVSNLQAILSQIQAPAKPAAGARVAPQPAAPAATVRAVAQAQPGGVPQTDPAKLNPNVPRGSYLNIVV
jgi:hypothetical protein